MAASKNDEAAVLKAFQQITKLIVENPYDPNPKEGNMRETHPHFFIGTSKKHLSPDGVDYLFSLFGKGKQAYAASQMMGISYPAARSRFDEWQAAEKALANGIEGDRQ